MSSVSELVPKESSVCILVRVCVWRAGKQKGKKLCCNHKLSCPHKDTACKLEDETRAGRREGKYVKAAFDPTKATDERYHADATVELLGESGITAVGVVGCIVAL